MIVADFPIVPWVGLIVADFSPSVMGWSVIVAHILRVPWVGQ